jgi:hypothetical protein
LLLKGVGTMRVRNLWFKVRPTSTLGRAITLVTLSATWLLAGTAWASVEPAPVSAPVPAAAWMGLALLAGIGVLGGLRKRLSRGND